MKKTLFGTTALVTAGLLASSGAHAESGIKLGLGGYMNNYFAVGAIDNDDDSDYNATGLYSDGEVWFTGSTTLDNGLTFGANIQLESFSTGDQVDENFGYVEGGFGKVQFGSENTAAYLMHYSAPSVGVPINSGWVTSLVPQPAGHAAGFRSPGLSTNLDIGNDENTLTYFTPRLYGFQLGASYVPAIVNTGEGKNNPVYANKNTEYNNGLSIGVNFVESFGAVDIAIAGGYRRASGPDKVVVAGNNVKLDDIEQWSTGVNIGFAGFTVGGSIAAETSGRRTRTGGAGLVGNARPFTTSTEGHSFDVGASYNTGPWTFGLGYIHGEVEGNVNISDDDTMQAVRAGVSYAVGPGITASASVLWAEWDDEKGGGSSYDSSYDSDGIVGVGGVTFNF